MILMAVCDARYIVSLVDIGSFGSNNDSGVFRNSPIGKVCCNNEMSLPVAECLEASPTFGNVPYISVCDEVFPLQSWLLRPYPGQGLPEEQTEPTFQRRINVVSTLWIDVEITLIQR